ncbi:MAG: hypothetical protein IJ736_08190 [Firmicutes bacterium]|nr:hypothetical protein [Bacillota bacterium]
MYTISFFGHREIDCFFRYESKIEEIIYKAAKDNPYVDILVGRDGDFDTLVSSVTQRIRRDIGKARIGLTWVMPYEKAEYTKNAEEFDKYYDNIEVCPDSLKVHPKSAIQVRNRYMVDRSDLVVFFVERDKGGAYQTMKYAIKQGKKILNIVDNL